MAPSGHFNVGVIIY